MWLPNLGHFVLCDAAPHSCGDAPARDALRDAGVNVAEHLEWELIEEVDHAHVTEGVHSFYLKSDEMVDLLLLLAEVRHHFLFISFGAVQLKLVLPAQEIDGDIGL